MGKIKISVDLLLTGQNHFNVARIGGTGHVAGHLPDVTSANHVRKLHFVIVYVISY